jgi:hypothetical protein
MAVHAAKPPGISHLPQAACAVFIWFHLLGQNYWRGQAISSGGFRDYSLPASAATGNGWGASVSTVRVVCGFPASEDVTAVRSFRSSAPFIFGHRVNKALPYVAV